MDHHYKVQVVLIINRTLQESNSTLLLIGLQFSKYLTAFPKMYFLQKCLMSMWEEFHLELPDKKKQIVAYTNNLKILNYTAGNVRDLHINQGIILIACSVPILLFIFNTTQTKKHPCIMRSFFMVQCYISNWYRPHVQ